tara:strand:- start:267 stop:392 length:126 start_codon:yes stop_codon:yes gene_type:complete
MTVLYECRKKCEELERKYDSLLEMYKDLLIRLEKCEESRDE